MRKIAEIRTVTMVSPVASSLSGPGTGSKTLTRASTLSGAGDRAGSGAVIVVGGSKSRRVGGGPDVEGAVPLAVAKVYRDSDWGEFQIQYTFGDQPGKVVTGFTDSREDALRTARSEVLFYECRYLESQLRIAEFGMQLAESEPETDPEPAREAARQAQARLSEFLYANYPDKVFTFVPVAA